MSWDSTPDKNKAGFIAALQEPRPPEKWKEEQPKRYNAFIETPGYMIFKLIKLI